jgi:mono/diheme cytochrome c family protein
MIRYVAGAVFAVAAFTAQALNAQTNSTPAAVRTSGDSIGPYDKQVVDASAADRGRTLFAAECGDCHGPLARGTDKGSNLIRSHVVLKDRYGSVLGPFLKKGHPLQSRKNSADLTPDQVLTLSHFLKQRIDDALKRSPTGINHVTGNVTAGKAFYEGPGKCGSCHSLTQGAPLTLFGIGTKYPDNVNLQQAMLFPGGGRGGRGARGGGTPSAAPAAPSPSTVTLTVTPPGEPPVTGVLVQLDDFDVQVRDSEGKVHHWSRSTALKVVKHDPLAAHHELLDRLTNDNVHDLVVYLETVK